MCDKFAFLLIHDDLLLQEVDHSSCGGLWVQLRGNRTLGFYKLFVFKGLFLSKQIDTSELHGVAEALVSHHGVGKYCGHVEGLGGGDPVGYRIIVNFCS